MVEYRLIKDPNRSLDRPKAGERAVLVGTANSGDVEAMSELEELALSAGAKPVATVTGRRVSPDPRFFIGEGKLREVAEAAKGAVADLVLFNNPLSASQERNLEKALGLRVVDRTGLILDIFAQRARSFEGKLQVELAQLEHLSSRLVRGWTHLERQKGGIGLRGPGETQLETDKRLIGKRIAQIRKSLEKVEGQRRQGRIGRRRANLSVVSLVGYTNAGKSTLFNALTGSAVQAEDQLFATLDPTVRRVALGPGLAVIMADTVGFIRHLPHELIAAFRSSLQETIEADLLLHVIDSTDPSVLDKVADVERVLQDIGAADVPRIKIFNKIDKSDTLVPSVEKNAFGVPVEISLSAKTGIGVPLLVKILGEYFSGKWVQSSYHLSASESRFRAGVYRVGRVLKEENDGAGGWHLEVEVPKWRFEYLRKLRSRGIGLNDGEM